MSHNGKLTNSTGWNAIFSWIKYALTGKRDNTQAVQDTEVSAESLVDLNARIEALESALTSLGVEADKVDYKIVQKAVANPSVPSSGTTTATSFISAITQDENGEIVPERRNLPAASASVSGITKVYTSTGDSTDGTMTRQAITNALAGKSDTGHTHDDRYYTETEVDTFLAVKAEQVDVTGYTSFSDIGAVVSAGNIPYYYHQVGVGAAKLYYQGTSVSNGVPPTVSQVFAGVFNGVLYETRFVNGASAFSAVVETPIFSAERVASSGESSSWSSDDTNVPTRAAVESKISSAMSGNVGGFMGVYSVSGINYLIAFTGYNFKNGDWFSMYDSGTITYYPNNDRSSSATISVSAGDDVYWTTTGVLLVRNMSAFATKSDLSKKAAGFTYELTRGKALKISLPWYTRTGRTSFLLHYPGNDNNYSMMQMSTFKGSSSVMEVPKVGVLSYSAKNSNSVPEIYYSRDSGSAQCIYISHTTNSNHVLTVMPTCENIESLVVEVVDRSEATGNTQSVPSRWSVFGPMGGTTAFTAKYDATGSSVDATPFSELAEAFDIYTDTIVLLYKYVSNGITYRRIYRMTDVQVDGNGNYSKFVFSRTNLGESASDDVGLQEIFECTSSGWSSRTTGIKHTERADVAEYANKYVTTEGTIQNIRDGIEARLVMDYPATKANLNQARTYYTSCVFITIPSIADYPSHLSTNNYYLNLPALLQWATVSIRPGMVFALWNNRGADVRLYNGDSTSAEYMTVKADRIGFVATWNGANLKLMTQ